jgi:hypothetical protein
LQKATLYTKEPNHAKLGKSVLRSPLHTRRNFLILIPFIALLFTFTACDNGKDKETPRVPDPAIIDNTNGLAFVGKVTIKTSDLYLDADWDAVVANVIIAFNAAYEDPTAPAPVKVIFENVFGGNGGEIILVNNLANNWEVRDGEFRTLYLKTSSIDTVVYRNAVQRMNGNNPSVGKATPPKDRVFLAYMFSQVTYSA